MDIEIFPHRYLSADTTENLLKDIDEIEGVKRIVLQGQRLPPAESGHPDRRVITLKGQEIDLQVKTGRVLMEIEAEPVMDEVRDVCENHLPFGFNIHVGTYIRRQKTVTDKLKYGEKLGEIPDEIIGLTDQNAQLSERVKILKRD
ncbi:MULTISPECIES: methyl-coenzyme M reductase operon protein D [Methanobacterium]|jgi:methyl-coenzyme M reductase subunit D|uniref:Methyl-coenzyme M reductase operon protein D n=1 Tax=Methanobacterium veterum TaxID=408577 RepID=A0A9E5A895_9EURY|nr:MULTISPECIES: methyl-coenzyme M reductase operon protein D [Methanobacterium]MCZ3366653.1 methyl-coenzyme M reductase operon protein D [Methanobacterium veterum]MCZ3374202.1 methyl-coenzyme M reductase operon protein D [Methanobacterium veterum]